MANGAKSRLLPSSTVWKWLLFCSSLSVSLRCFTSNFLVSLPTASGDFGSTRFSLTQQGPGEKMVLSSFIGAEASPSKIEAKLLSLDPIQQLRTPCCRHHSSCVAYTTVGAVRAALLAFIIRSCIGLGTVAFASRKLTQPGSGLLRAGKSVESARVTGISCASGIVRRTQWGR